MNLEILQINNVYGKVHGAVLEVSKDRKII